MEQDAAKKDSLRVLYVEDSPQDVDIINELLTEAGFEVSMDITEKKNEYISLLQSRTYDVILSDFKLPGFDAFGALQSAIEICPNTPFICVSGSIGEDIAIDLIKRGAVDYVLKDRLGRLPLAIKRAIHEVKEKESRQHAEEALRESERRFHVLAENSPVGIFQTDGEGNTIYVNPRWCEISGLPKEKAMGTAWLEAVHSEDKEQVSSGWKKAAHEHVPSQAEYRFIRPDGKIAWVIGQAIPEKDSENKIVGYVGTITDITSRKLAEEELRENEAKRNELERELIQAQKLEGLGTLASGIAHDFNNLLSIILGHASLLAKKNIEGQAAQNKNVDAIVNAARRGATLVNQMLTFARKTEVLTESLSLNDIINELIKLLRETFPKMITVEAQLDENLPLIDADATQVHQVLLNLCVNARDAMPAGGKLMLSTYREAGEALRDKHPKATCENYVVLAVADTGTGIDEETQRRMFEPFFTTKEHGKGTGLGLSLVFGIMESHNGFITFHSEVGKGTTFQCYFPVPDKALERVRVEEDATETVPGGDETILVVEDEESLRELLCEILEPKGYTVLTAEDGEKGMTVYQKYRKEIALVISDLGLPKFGGDELFRRLKKANPDVRLILSSGYMEPGMKFKTLKDGVRDFIPKPYNPNEVLRVVYAVLHGGK